MASITQFLYYFPPPLLFHHISLPKLALFLTHHCKGLYKSCSTESLPTTRHATCFFGKVSAVWVSCSSSLYEAISVLKSQEVVWTRMEEKGGKDWFTINRTKCHMVYWIGTRNRKINSWKKWWNPNEVCSSVNSTVPMLMAYVNKYTMAIQMLTLREPGWKI